MTSFFKTVQRFICRYNLILVLIFLCTLLRWVTVCSTGTGFAVEMEVISGRYATAVVKWLTNAILRFNTFFRSRPSLSNSKLNHKMTRAGHLKIYKFVLHHNNVHMYLKIETIKQLNFNPYDREVHERTTTQITET